MPGRSFTSSVDKYKYGFNGMEKDDEVKGDGNSLDFGARIYDPRIGRWMSRDPLASKYPMDSPYMFAGNSPIDVIDPDGEEKIVVSGAEESTGRYRLNFIIPAAKLIKQIASKNEATTWVIFDKNYTRFQKAVIKLFASRQANTTVVFVNTADELISYMNTKTTSSANSDVSQGRKDDPITQTTMFSHGVPGEVAFGYGNEERPQMALNEANVPNINPEAFAANSKTDIYACRIGASQSYSECDPTALFDDAENSLAQKYANQTGSETMAFQSRTEYSNILGGKFNLLRRMNNWDSKFSPNSAEWIQHVEETTMPTKGATPRFAPGKTIFRPNQKPEVKEHVK